MPSHGRTEERLGYRNGNRPRTLATQAGDIDLLIAKLLTGGFLPSILEPHRRVDQALYTAIMEASIGGVSTCLPRRRPAAEHSADVMRHSHQASVD